MAGRTTGKRRLARVRAALQAAGLDSVPLEMPGETRTAEDAAAALSKQWEEHKVEGWILTLYHFLDCDINSSQNAHNLSRDLLKVRLMSTDSDFKTVLANEEKQGVDFDMLSLLISYVRKRPNLYFCEMTLDFDKKRMKYVLKKKKKYFHFLKKLFKFFKFK